MMYDVPDPLLSDEEHYDLWFPKPPKRWEDEEGEDDDEE